MRKALLLSRLWARELRDLERDPLLLLVLRSRRLRLLLRSRRLRLLLRGRSLSRPRPSRRSLLRAEEASPAFWAEATELSTDVSLLINLSAVLSLLTQTISAVLCLSIVLSLLTKSLSIGFSLCVEPLSLHPLLSEGDVDNWSAVDDSCDLKPLPSPPLRLLPPSRLPGLPRLQKLTLISIAAMVATRCRLLIGRFIDVAVLGPDARPGRLISLMPPLVARSVCRSVVEAFAGVLFERETCRLSGGCLGMLKFL